MRVPRSGCAASCARCVHDPCDARMTNTPTYRIGMDVGGTFTDCVLLKEDGSIVLEKAPTTHGDQSEGVFAGLARLADAEGLASVDELLARTATVVHGTT